jgi:hypothetical protein
MIWGRDVTSFGDDETGCLPHHPNIPEMPTLASANRKKESKE